MRTVVIFFINLVIIFGNHPSLVLDHQDECLDDGSYCYEANECCSQECNHHWPPTTTPVFGVCGEVPECQVTSRDFKETLL